MFHFSNEINSDDPFKEKKVTFLLVCNVGYERIVRHCLSFANTSTMLRSIKILNLSVSVSSRIKGPDSGGLDILSLCKLEPDMSICKVSEGLNLVFVLMNEILVFSMPSSDLNTSKPHSDAAPGSTSAFISIDLPSIPSRIIVSLADTFVAGKVAYS